MPGIYRVAYGSRIVQSSYDFEKQQIGPIKVPVKLNYIPADSQRNNFCMYRFYEEMLKNPNSLAVFNLNNYCLVVVERTCMYEVSYLKVTEKRFSKLELLDWTFSYPIDLPIYNHVGYVKTYHNCWAVSQYPEFLVEDTVTKNLYGFEEKLQCSPVVNPPLSLYRELINSDAQAVYMSSVDGLPKFIYH